MHNNERGQFLYFFIIIQSNNVNVLENKNEQGTIFIKITATPLVRVIKQTSTLYNNIENR